jgi:hypothetical protein
MTLDGWKELTLVRNFVGILTDAADAADLRAELATVTAERDAALARVAALEAQCGTCDHKARGAFYFDMVAADAAWKRAQDERRRR